jgi:hypothetical protein
MNKIYWDLDQNGVDYPGRYRESTDDPPSGHGVLPGKYKVVIEYGTNKDSNFVHVLTDPRRNVSIQDLKAQDKTYQEFYKIVKAASKAYDLIKDARTSIEITEKLIINQDDSVKTSFKDLHKSLNGKLDTLEGMYKLVGETKGIQRNPGLLNSTLFSASSYISNSEGAPNASAKRAIELAEIETNKAINAIHSFYEQHWSKYKEKVDALQPKIFKTYKAIKIE